MNKAENELMKRNPKPLYFKFDYFAYLRLWFLIRPQQHKATARYVQVLKTIFQIQNNATIAQNEC